MAFEFFHKSADNGYFIAIYRKEKNFFEKFTWTNAILEIRAIKVSSGQIDYEWPIWMSDVSQLAL